MPLLRALLALRVPLLGLGAALLTVVLAATGAVLPVRAAIATPSVATSSVSIAFVGAGIWGGDLRSTYALTTKPVSAQFYLRREWRTAGGGTALITAAVERRVGGGSWKATAQRVSTRTSTFRAHIPAYSTRTSAPDATVAYRLRIRTPGIVGSGDVSSALTVHYRNPARFTGLTASLYRTVHPYCPSAVVRVVRLTGDEAGDYTTGQYALLVDASIAGYAPVNRRAVALHECGHYLQWRNYGGTTAGWNAMKKDAKAIFGTNSSQPVEHMADCTSRAANPGGYLGYGGTCTAPQLAAAKRMLAGERAR